MPAFMGAILRSQQVRRRVRPLQAEPSVLLLATVSTQMAVQGGLCTSAAVVVLARSVVEPVAPAVVSLSMRVPLSTAVEARSCFVLVLALHRLAVMLLLPADSPRQTRLGLQNPVR